MSDQENLLKIELELKYAESVWNDLEEIESFLSAEASIGVAEAVIEEIISRCEDLPAMPKASKKRDEIKLGLRSVTAGRYVIYFWILKDNVYVARVLHGSRDTTAMKGEL